MHRCTPVRRTALHRERHQLRSAPAAGTGLQEAPPICAISRIVGAQGEGTCGSRLARGDGDVQLGCHVLTTMAMQALMRGFASEAADMAQGAFNRATGQTTAPQCAAMPCPHFAIAYPEIQRGQLLHLLAKA